MTTSCHQDKWIFYGPEESRIADNARTCLKLESRGYNRSLNLKEVLPEPIPGAVQSPPRSSFAAADPERTPLGGKFTMNLKNNVCILESHRIINVTKSRHGKTQLLARLLKNHGAKATVGTTSWCSLILIYSPNVSNHLTSKAFDFRESPM